MTDDTPKPLSGFGDYFVPEKLDLHALQQDDFTIDWWEDERGRISDVRFSRCARYTPPPWWRRLWQRLFGPRWHHFHFTRRKHPWP